MKQDKEKLKDELIKLLHERIDQYEIMLAHKDQIIRKITAESKVNRINLLDEFPAVVITNFNSEVEFVNRIFTEQTGFSLNEIKGRKIGSVLQHDDFTEEKRAEMRQKLNNGDSLYEELHPNYSKDGKKLICKLFVFPLISEDGTIRFLSFASFVGTN